MKKYKLKITVVISKHDRKLLRSPDDRRLSKAHLKITILTYLFASFTHHIAYLKQKKTNQ